MELRINCVRINRSLPVFLWYTLKYKITLILHIIFRIMKKNSSIRLEWRLKTQQYNKMFYGERFVKDASGFLVDCQKMHHGIESLSLDWDLASPNDPSLLIRQLGCQLERDLAWRDARFLSYLYGNAVIPEQIQGATISIKPLHKD